MRSVCALAMLIFSVSSVGAEKPIPGVSYKCEDGTWRKCCEPVPTPFEATDAEIGPKPVASLWDGSYSAVERWLEARLHDPDSLEMAGCSMPTRAALGWRVRCEYRARNGFGVMRLSSGWFTIRQLEVVAQD